MNFRFNEENINTRRRNQLNNKVGGVTTLLIKIGLAKNENSATKVMLVAVIIFLIIIAYLWWPTSPGVELTPAQAERAGNPSEVTSY